MIIDGKQHRYGGTIPWSMSPWAIANLGAGLLEVEQMCKTLPLEAPWEAKKAAEWDRTTVAGWIEKNTLSKQAPRDAGYGPRRALHLGRIGDVAPVDAVSASLRGRSDVSDFDQGRRPGGPPGRRHGRHLPPDGRRTGRRAAPFAAGAPHCAGR